MPDPRYREIEQAVRHLVAAELGDLVEQIECAAAGSALAHEGTRLDGLVEAAAIVNARRGALQGRPTAAVVGSDG